MLKKIVFIISSLLGTTAFAGIIGTGGVNANENPEIMRAFRAAENIQVPDHDFRRLSVRIGDKGIVNADITSTSGERIRGEFGKVIADGQAEIVDSNVTKVLEPRNP
ncbi:MAG: hypothetical protein EOP10_09215 [Proteobacteria bacterium]|nr:MAG: hypothetical protein EOP10_09215 [Pseudomonadota bacterium]